MQTQPFVRVPPTRRLLVSYPTYQEAQQAVDYLSDQQFPVERTAIVAEGLRFVEQVTGRRGYGPAVLEGTGAGALIGLFLGFIFGLFNWVEPLLSGFVLAINGLIVGAIIGASFGLPSHALARGRRDFSAFTGMQADRYNILVDGELFNQAYRLLDEAAGDGVPAMTQS